MLEFCGLCTGEDGLTSESMEIGDIGVSILGALRPEVNLGSWGVREVACDIRRTRRGLMCFPSEFV